MRRVDQLYVEKPCDPFFLLTTPNTNLRHVKKVRGEITDLGETYLVVDGERFDIALSEGLTGKDGDKKRNPKVAGEVLHAFDGVEKKLHIQASQTRAASEGVKPLMCLIAGVSGLSQSFKVDDADEGVDLGSVFGAVLAG